MLFSGNKALKFTDVFKEGLLTVARTGSFGSGKTDITAMIMAMINNGINSFCFIGKLLLLQVYFVNCRCFSILYNKARTKSTLS